VQAHDPFAVVGAPANGGGRAAGTRAGLPDDDIPF
jgi:hypothetical protein